MSSGVKKSQDIPAQQQEYTPTGGIEISMGHCCGSVEEGGSTMTQH